MTDRQTPVERFRGRLWRLAEKNQAAMLPRRGDAVEKWLKAHRDRFREQTDEWFLLDELLDDYRLHADTGAPLDQHCCENGTVDDCYGCYTQQHPPIRSCNLDHVHDAHSWEGDGTTYGCIGFPERKEAGQ